jgi:hypothetical protein
MYCFCIKTIFVGIGKVWNGSVTNFEGVNFDYWGWGAVLVFFFYFLVNLMP